MPRRRLVDAHLPAGQRRRLTEGAAHASLAALSRWDPVGLGYVVHRHAGAPLSGRCYAVVHPLHLAASTLCADGRATFALCGMAIRRCLRAGDVCLVVSPGQSHGRTRNIATQHRLILCVVIVAGVLEPWVYHSIAAPEWAFGRSDRIYTCRLARGGGWRPQDRLRQLRSASPTLGRTTFREIGPANDHTWRVTYGGAGARYLFEYRLRSRVRWHQEPGESANSIVRGARDRDLRAPVPWGHAYAVYASSEQHQRALPWASLCPGVEPGLGVRTVPFARGSRLRRWVERTRR